MCVLNRDRASSTPRKKLIDNRPAALIAAALTAIACYATIRALVQPTAVRGSVLLLQFPGAYSRSAVGINILLEIIFAFVIMGVAVSVKSWERVLVCSYSALLFLTQGMYLLPGAITAIRWIKMVCALIALIAAVMLLVQFENQSIRR